MEERLRAFWSVVSSATASAYRLFLGDSRRTCDLSAHAMSGCPGNRDLVQELLLAISNNAYLSIRAALTEWVSAICSYKLIDLSAPPFPYRRAQRSTRDEDEFFARRYRARGSFGMTWRNCCNVAGSPRLPILYVKIEGCSVADARTRIVMVVIAFKVGHSSRP